MELFKSEIFEHANDSVDYSSPQTMLVASNIRQLDEEITATSSSIHSVLYLAFKNHAAFLLDRLKTQPSIDLEDPITRKSFERTVIWFAEVV